MFSDQFSNVLKDALSRQGTSSLFSGPIQSEPPPDRRCAHMPIHSIAQQCGPLHSTPNPAKELWQSVTRTCVTAVAMPLCHVERLHAARRTFTTFHCGCREHDA